MANDVFATHYVFWERHLISDSVLDTFDVDDDRNISLTVKCVCSQNGPECDYYGALLNGRKVEIVIHRGQEILTAECKVCRISEACKVRGKSTITLFMSGVVSDWQKKVSA